MHATDSAPNTTTKTAIIFGAGPGLGTALAHKFGREGYRLALVARTLSRLETLVADLATKGIAAQAFPTDLTDIAALPALITRIEAALGPVDAAVYAPISAGLSFDKASAFDAAAYKPYFDLFTFAPIEIAHALLASMKPRQTGAFVYVGGVSALFAAPGFSGPGQAMAAARNYIHALNIDAAPDGIYAGAVFIGGVIENSASDKYLKASGQTSDFPSISPVTIADEILSMITTRTKIETSLPTA